MNNSTNVVPLGMMEHSDESLLECFNRLDLIKSSREFDKNSIIVMENDLNEDIHLIVSGRVEVSNVLPNGKEIWFAELGPGNIFGEVSALTGNKRLWSVKALERTHVALVTREEFYQVLRKNPEVGISLLESLAGRVEKTTDLSVNVISMTVSQRICAELLDLLRPCASEQGKLTISPTPNFSAMARRLNTDRENVSREISSLSQKGVVEKKKTGLLILDKAYLERSLIG